MAWSKQYTRGVTLVESLVVIAIITIILGALFLSFRAVLLLTAENRAQLTALSFANDQLEYIRSLSYSEVGTVSGIPNGPLQQVSTSTHNGIEFVRKILVEYVDDPADGTGAADANGITTDYKRARVEYKWSVGNSDHATVLVTNIIPPAIESNVGGGTLRVNVFDADVQPLPGASVRVVNDSTSPAIDLTRTTNSAGIALVGGAPAGPEYEIFVTDTGYSQDQTNRATTSLPSPDTSPVTVVQAGVTTMNFFIDTLSTVTVNTLAAKTVNETTLAATQAGDIASANDIHISSTSTTLATSTGGYVSSGTVWLDAAAPSPNEEWGVVSWQASTTPSTDVSVQVYQGSSTTALVPDSELPGNSSGFNAPFDLRSVDPAAYPELGLGVTLETVSSVETPAVSAVTVANITSVTPQPSTDFSLRSSKTIGTDAGSQPVYKHVYNETTDAAGQRTLTDVEWDAYHASVPAGQTIAEACPGNPVEVTPGGAATLDLTVVPASAHSLRVHVDYADGSPVPDAEVTITEGGVSQTANTTGCGQVYFNGLSNATYTVGVSVVGETDPPDQSVPVDGDTVEQIGL